MGNSITAGLGVGPLAVGGSVGGTQGDSFIGFGKPTNDVPRAYKSYSGGQSSQYPSGLSVNFGGAITGGATIDATRTWVFKLK